jgi:phosphohistidine phosphatase
VAFASSIYDATPDALLELIRLADDAVSTLLLIGHAPGMPQTAWELAADRTGPAATELSRKFPTSALAVLQFDLPWAQVDTGTGELVTFHVPR